MKKYTDILLFFPLYIISKGYKKIFDWKENNIRLGYDTCRESIIMRSKYELKKFWSLKKCKLKTKLTFLNAHSSDVC